MRAGAGAVLAALLLTGCGGEEALSPAASARSACAEVEDLVTSPSMDQSYPGRYGKAADSAADAREGDPAWTGLAEALANARDAAQGVVDAAEDPATRGTGQKAANDAYRRAQAAAQAACAAV